MAKNKEIEFEASNSKIKLGTSDYIVRGIGYVLVTLYAIACVFPFLIIIGFMIRFVHYFGAFFCGTCVIPDMKIFSAITVLIESHITLNRVLI